MGKLSARTTPVNLLDSSVFFKSFSTTANKSFGKIKKK